MYYSTWYSSPVGPLYLASDGENLVGLWLEGQKYFAAGLAEAHVEQEDLPVFREVRAWLDRYFAKERPGTDGLPLAPRGSAFQQEVWRLLRQIPYGQVTTYGALAAAAAGRLGRAHMPAQAVGSAVGHNPISILIPCHRVVGADGSLTGYAGGLEKKRLLLEHEGADPASIKKKH